MKELTNRLKFFTQVTGIKDNLPIRETLLDHIINERLLIQDFKQKGLEYSPELGRKVEGIRIQFYLDALIKKPFRTAPGGKTKETTETALLEAEVEGRRISTHTMVIDEIGEDENGIPIEILFGALAMQQWGIRLIPEQEKLDLTHYPEEFVEF